MVQNDITKVVYGNCADRISTNEKQEIAEFVEINTPVVLDQIEMRKCFTRNIALSPSDDNFHPAFTLKNITDFQISKLCINSITNIAEEKSLKSLELCVKIDYSLFYSDGLHTLMQRDNAELILNIDKIEYPELNIKCFSSECKCDCKNNLNIKIDAIAEPFGEMICPCTGALIFDIGLFLIIRSECVTQICIPDIRCSFVPEPPVQ